MIHSAYSLRLPSGPITDEVVDALLGPYNKDDPYPALTSRNLARREMREMKIQEQRSPECAGSAGAYGGSVHRLSPLTDGALSPVGQSTNVSLMESVMKDMADADLERLLESLALSASDERITRLLIAGTSLQEIATEMGTSRQAIHRRKGVIRDFLQLWWLNDTYRELRECLREDTYRNVYLPFSHAAVTSAPLPAEGCDCGSTSHRIQRPKSPKNQTEKDRPTNQAVTYHCTGCGKVRSREELDALCPAPGA